MSGDIVFLLLAFLLIFTCGLFVAAEFALLTVNRSRVHHLAKTGDRAAIGVEKALKSLSTQLSGAQIGITITNLGIGFLAQPSIGRMVSAPLQAAGMDESLNTGISVVLALILATALTMIFGELVPKNLAIVMPLETAKRIQRFQRGFSWIMTYPIRICNGVANAFIRQLGIEPREELASARSGDELSSLVRRSAEKGTLAKDTALMLERSLTFGEHRAEEVMTPRARMETIKKDSTVHDVIELTKTTGFSRFPVIDEDADDIVGVVYIKHAVNIARAERAATPVSKIMKKPMLVPSSIQLDPLLKALRGNGLQMAILIDEFGGTDGLVTVEDLIEELVGEVADEHAQSNRLMQPKGNNTWLLSGLLRPDEVNQLLPITLPDEEEFETLGGLIIERLERIPKKGDEVRIDTVDRTGAERTVVLTIIKMDDLRVDTVRLTIKKRSKA